MLFNSFAFIFGFLPAALLVTFALGKWRRWAAELALLLFSLGFYAYWNIKQLPLLLFSIAFNYLVGGLIQRAFAQGRSRTVQGLLVFGALVDLSLLGWFKYANFTADNLSFLFGADLGLKKIALPLAISFFTFQKLAYLIDSARGETKPIRFLDFSLFAAFFPQLIAGPIVHFAEVVPQMRRRLFGRFRPRDLMVGLVLFGMGLFKKTVIADTLSAQANPLYHAVSAGHSLGLEGGWLAAVGFTLQVYFDFSGYSDMAIGLGRMFGVRLPLNFHSPLRAGNIVDYWRRWHMTLQRFILAYLFQPLAAPLNRLVAAQGLKGWSAFFVGLAVPTFITFVAVGIWHGAGWTFVLFGVMHAVYICCNETWTEALRRRRRRLRKAGRPTPKPGAARIAAFRALTLIAVIYANALFRAPNVGEALVIWRGMTGLAGLGVGGGVAANWGFWATIFIGAAIVALLPNTQQIMGRFDPAFNWREWKDVARPPIVWTWRPNLPGILFAAVTLFVGVIFIQRGQAIFLYFNF